MIVNGAGVGIVVIAQTSFRSSSREITRLGFDPKNLSTLNSIAVRLTGRSDRLTSSDKKSMQTGPNRTILLSPKNSNDRRNVGSRTANYRYRRIARDDSRVVFAVFFVIPFWRIFQNAGFTPYHF
jgi:hypothetical protein